MQNNGVDIRLENTKENKIKWQKFILLFIGGGIGILLLIFGGGFGREAAADEAAQTDLISDVSADAYARSLEQRISDICGSVRGAGEVRVFVSLKGGYRTVYAYDSQSSSSGYKSQLVLSGSGSGRSAVVTAYENPEIAGVGIVCDGADSADVRQQLISLVSSALGISTNKIFVAEAK